MRFYAKREIRFFARYAILAIYLSFTAIVIAVDFYKFSTNSSVNLGFGYVIAYNIIEIFGVYVYATEIHEKIFSMLEISYSQIIFKCIFIKKKAITIERCRFIGVEFEDSFSKSHLPFIYFSTEQYPKEYSHKINKINNSDQFIKFWYTDELAEYLLTHLPKEKTGALQYYCNRKKAESRNLKRRLR